jgi:LuxR family maltose regulon positive regulatory protein
LRAVALEFQGRDDRALKALNEALSLAEAEGYVRSLVDQGPAVARLLQKVKAEGDRLTYVRALLQAFGEDEAGRPASQDEQGLIELLTDRELEVLQLVALGMSNRDIAAELVVATGTVKAHVSRIMGKLGAHNRTEAVALARDLDLIP